MTSNITIIGAGVIGAATALTLQQRGHEVLLLDRERPSAGASFGNAGAIVNGSCVPQPLKAYSSMPSKCSVNPILPCVFVLLIYLKFYLGLCVLCGKAARLQSTKMPKTCTPYHNMRCKAGAN